MAKRKVPPPDTWLADFRESAGLTPPPRTLSNAASRLVDLLDEFLYSLQCGWDIPPGFPRDKFVPSVLRRRDLISPIFQYLVDLGFTGDARRLHEAAEEFFEHLDWRLMTPRPGDDKGWKEFQERYVMPLWLKRSRLEAVIREVRQLINDMGSKGCSAKLGAETEDGEVSQPVVEKPIKSKGGLMGDVDLAAALGVHSSKIPAFRAKLKRMRDKGELSIDDWQEFKNPKCNEPRFLYHANTPAIVAMAKRYSHPK